ncbi:MAG: alanine--tRNA ligase, partial [Gemmatimonadota bacterium]|nr:alanine--tRNA ligase [Gemmatimonadota bacterium]
KHIRVTVFESDNEARALWREVAGLPDSRIYGLGEKDNFWQMADTGPCGPCSEIFVDLVHNTDDWRFPEGATGEWVEVPRTDFSQDAFVEGTEAGRFLEIWNLVFMQFDRQQDGTLVPLPKPSVDTGAGLERISAVMQRRMNNFDTDVFEALIADAEKVMGMTRGEGSQLVSFRVLADHARAVAFLLGDGIFPSNDGRGYVLRRILRRAVRHAWLLGRAEPTLFRLVETVIRTMGDVYPELPARATHIIETTRAEEQRFLDTIEGGMRRFEQLAPLNTTQGSTALRGTVAGEDAFKLYDTFGFPIDLTELMARERGYTVDIAGFERALEAQRTSSREERKTRSDLHVSADELADASKWEQASSPVEASALRFVGYDAIEIETDVAAIRHLDGGRIAMLLRETPFYAESGGQISDSGEITGKGYRVLVDEVRKIDGRSAAVGALEGEFAFGRVTARVPSTRRRDTERNHTATHLLHAALREILGDHVHQAGSLVAPDRLRFDFTHHGPVRPEQLDAIEEWVNRGIWADLDVVTQEKPYSEAVAGGAMALFGEKYGDRVRVVSIAGLSQELCGGTHARHTGQIALFKIASENGVAAGVRRIEAVTGPKAYELVRGEERSLARVAELVRAPQDGVVKRVESLLEERRALQRRLDDAMRGGGDQLTQLLGGAQRANGSMIVAGQVQAADVKELQALADALREKMSSGVGVIAATLADGKTSLIVIVTDDLRAAGVRADAIIKDIAAVGGGRGGGKPHMAQAGMPDASRVAEAIAQAPAIVRAALPSHA